MPWVYVLRCSDETLYIGRTTTDVAVREQTHNEGRGGRHTARRRPVRVVYSEQIGSVEAAIKRERQLKGWTTRKKLALVAGDSAMLKQLSRRRRPSKSGRSKA